MATKPFDGGNAAAAGDDSRRKGGRPLPRKGGVARQCVAASEKPKRGRRREMRTRYARSEVKAFGCSGDEAALMCSSAGGRCLDAPYRRAPAAICVLASATARQRGENLSAASISIGGMAYETRCCLFILICICRQQSRAFFGIVAQASLPSAGMPSYRRPAATCGAASAALKRDDVSAAAAPASGGLA